MGKRVALAVSALLLVIGLVLCFLPTLQASATPTGSADDWPMFQHDPAHTSHSTSLFPLNVTEVWRHHVSAPPVSSPIIVGGIVYVGTDSPYALNASTGDVIWQTGDHWGIYSSPAVYAGSLYTGDRAYNASTGKLLWNVTLDGANLFPTVANGTVYVNLQTTETKNLYALNASNGAKLWEVPAGAMDGSFPAVAYGHVYAVVGEGFSALDASTGNTVWSSSINSLVGSPVVGDGIVYISSASSDSVYALNAMNGSGVWTRYLFGERLSVWGSFVYVSHGTILDALNASTGDTVWSFRTDDWIRTTPALAEGVVCFGSDDGNVYALNAFTGRRIWNYSIQPHLNERGLTGAIYSSPSIANGTIYIGSINYYGGSIVALGVKPKPTTSPLPTPTVPEFPIALTLTTVITVISASAIALKRRNNSRNLKRRMNVSD